MFAFGFASGIPYYIIKGGVLSIWMSDAGVDITKIGLYSLVGLPYTIKFLWAPAMDGFTPTFLGRRKGWILIAQICLVIIIITLGQFNPAESLWWIALTALGVAFFGASQDIVLDAFRREYLNDEELGFGTGVWMNAFRVGGIACIGLTVFTDYDVGWPSIHIMLSVLMLIGIITTFLVPEPKVKNKPITFSEAVVQPFIEFLSRDGAIMILLFILLYKIGDNMAGAMNIPFILKMNFTKAEYFVLVKGIGMAGLFGGVFVGGAIMIRLGLAKSLWIFGILQAISTAFFALLIIIDHDTQIWILYRNHILGAIVGFELFATGLGQAAYATYMAKQTNKKFTATQYALLTSLMAVPGIFAASITGFIVEFVGWSNFYYICALIAIPGMLLLFKLAPWNATNKEIGVQND